MTAGRTGDGRAVPLLGRRIVVTRAADQASKLASRLEGLGATVVLAPTIRFEPLEFEMPSGLTWIVVTSPNGVAALVGQSIGMAQIAVVGPGTADAATTAGFTVALVPPRAIADSLVDAFPAAVHAGRVAVVQADIARPTVAEGLAVKGWEVVAITAYRTLPVAPDPAVIAAVAAAEAITFTSGSTVRSFVTAYGTAATPPQVISIGPVTSATCTELGVRVTSEAVDHDIDGLVTAVLSAFL